MTTRKAFILERALERTFRTAGGRADRQPPTARLLGDLFSKEDITALFPGRQNLEQTERNAALAVELADALRMKSSVTKEAVLDEVRSRIHYPSTDEKELNGVIRFDLCLAASFPVQLPRELWIDHAIVQETSKSYQDDVIAFLEAFDEPGKSE